MKFIPNTDAADITGVTAGTGLSGGGTTGSVTLNVDASIPEITTLAGLTSIGTLTGLTLDGDKSVTPGDGAMIHLDTSTITDSNTAEEGTAALYTHVRLEGPTLAATEASVVTTDAATLYVTRPGSGTNQTLVNTWGIYTDGAARTFGITNTSNYTQSLGDMTLYDANNDANPTISLGSSATNRLEIKSTYNSGTQTLCDVNFSTYTASGTSNDGRFIFEVDEVEVLKLLDSTLVAAGNINCTNGAFSAMNTTTSSATEGGLLKLQSNDGAVMADNHRLGVIEFKGAEDTSSTMSIGARIQAIARDAWDGSNNDADLEFYTTDGTTESKALTLDADNLATFAGAVTVTGALTGTLATVSQPNITGVGTIGTGVWEGTAIATDQQKHLMHYEFMGFNNSTADTVYEFAESMSDTKAPLEHTADHNATITTAMVVGTYFKAGGQVIQQAGTIKRIVGWAHSNGTTAEHKLALVMLRPAENDNTAVAPVLVDEITWTSLGGNKLKAINETTITAASVNAGDILMTMIKDDTGGRQVYFNITVELEV